MTPLAEAAEALRAEFADEHEDGTFSIEGGVRDEQFFRDLATSVLIAIRDPSDAMKRAAEKATGDMFTGLEAAAFTAMINAAIEEG